VDTSEQVILDETPKQIVRRRRSVEEKRRIVEETLETGASVARVARRHAVNANQVFYWRKKYREGRLGKRQSSKLLPVTLSDNSLSKSGRAGCASSPFAVGTMEIKLSQGTLRVAGNVDVVVLRAAIECLLG
jgi:transposase